MKSIGVFLDSRNGVTKKLSLSINLSSGKRGSLSLLSFRTFEMYPIFEKVV
jgi:hypothetical protein